MNDIFLNLIKKKKPICVWGAGYIGLSTLAFYSRKGINSLGYDIDKKYLSNLSKGKIKNDDFKKWLGFDIKPLVQKKKLKFTNSVSEIKKINPQVHFVCIPTEKNGKPLMKILFQTIKNVINLIDDKGIIIIESTLTPGTGDLLIKKFLKELISEEKIQFVIAPRRDWFVDGTKNLENMDRIYGGVNTKSQVLGKKILSIVCKRLHVASSHKVAEMVKSFENCYRHVDIALANQLSKAFPKENIRETLRLVGTKWNIGTFYPGFGSGGYCIPLSSKYVINGSKKKKELSILKETIKTDSSINLDIAKSIVKKKLKKIAILGLSYKSNLKVHTLSPILPFINYLKKKKISVSLFDPYYSKDEIKNIAKVRKFKFPNELKNFDCLVFHINHKYFAAFHNRISKNSKLKFIIDNTGALEKYKNDMFKNETKYVLTGDCDWL